MVSTEDVRRALDPDEPDYKQAAASLGPEALPILAELAKSSDVMLASKAVSLAGRIGGLDAVAILEHAAQTGPAEVRVVAAAATGRVTPLAENVLLNLIQDPDPGVRKYALRAVPAAPSARLREVLEVMRTSDSDPSVRRQVSDVLPPEKRPDYPPRK